MVEDPFFGSADSCSSHGRNRPAFEDLQGTVCEDENIAPTHQLLRPLDRGLPLIKWRGIEFINALEAVEFHLRLLCKDDHQWHDNAARPAREFIDIKVE